MKKYGLRLLLIVCCLYGSFLSSQAQELSNLQDVLVSAPGFPASKALDRIKQQANGSHGLQFVAYYAQSDLIHFRINRTLSPDNSEVYSLLPDLNFTIIEDPKETKRMLDEVTIPKNNTPAPVIKSE